MKAVNASLVLAGALGTLAAVPAHGQVVTFGPTGQGFISGPITENGFTYSEESGSLLSQYYGNPRGDLEGYSFEGGGVASFVSSTGSLFQFLGLDYSAYASSGTGSQTLEVRGYRGGSLLGTDTFTLLNTADIDRSNTYPSFANWTTFDSVNLAGLSLDQFQVTLNGSSIDSQQFDFQAIDNVRFGSAVPEPSTWAMMLVGFGVVGGAMRSAGKQRKPAVSYS